MATPFGRPIKNADLLETLDTDSLYKASTIAALADLNHLSEEEQRKEKKRIRMALGRLAKSRSFPPTGDGAIKEKGQPISPAWYGWRWKTAGLHPRGAVNVQS